MAETEFFLGCKTPAGTMSVPITVGFSFEDIVAWLRSVYGQVEETPAGRNEETGEFTPAVMRDQTPQELLRRLANATGVGHANSVAAFVHQRNVAQLAKPEAVVTLGEAEITPAA